MDIIIAPVITEKSEYLKNTENTYVFKVKPNANKTQIKNAVEKAFNVKVISVNTLNVRSKIRRVGKYIGKTSSYKKAYVKLDKDSSIDL